MAFNKGQSKVAGSGRKKGTINKKSQALADRAAELGIDPFEILLFYAAGDYEKLGCSEFVVKTSPDGSTWEEEAIPHQLRQKSAKDVAEYIHPKLKSVEISGGLDTTTETYEEYLRRTKKESKLDQKKTK